MASNSKREREDADERILTYESDVSEDSSKSSGNVEDEDIANLRKKVVKLKDKFKRLQLSAAMARDYANHLIHLIEGRDDFVTCAVCGSFNLEENLTFCHTFSHGPATASCECPTLDSIYCIYCKRRPPSRFNVEIDFCKSCNHALCPLCIDQGTCHSCRWNQYLCLPLLTFVACFTFRRQQLLQQHVPFLPKDLQKLIGRLLIAHSSLTLDFFKDQSKKQEWLYRKQFRNLCLKPSSSSDTLGGSSFTLHSVEQSIDCLLALDELYNRIVDKDTRNYEFELSLAHSDIHKIGSHFVSPDYSSDFLAKLALIFKLA